jgi:hypothetical protein
VTMNPRSFARRLLYAAAVSVVGGSSGCTDPPSDAELIKEFHEHRAEYQRLLTMFREDRGLGRIAPTFTRPANFFSGAPLPTSPDISGARLEEYRALFRRLSLEAGVEGYDDKRIIEFLRYGEGFGAGLGGSGKGLAFSDSLPPDQPATFGCETPESNCWRYQPIGEGWFIFTQRHN